MYNNTLIHSIFGNINSIEAQRFVVALADSLHAGWQESRALLKDEKGNQILNSDGTARREPRFKPVKNDPLFVAKYISENLDFSPEEAQRYITIHPEKLEEVLKKIEEVNINPNRTIRYDQDSKQLQCDIANRPNSELSMNLQSENLQAARTAFAINHETMQKTKPFLDDYEKQRDSYNEAVKLMIGFNMSKPDYNSENFKEELKAYNEEYNNALKNFIGFKEERPEGEENDPAVKDYMAKFREACYKGLPKPNDSSATRIQFALFASYSEIHDEWMKRNPADGPEKYTPEELEEMEENDPGNYTWTMQHAPFGEISTEEKLKDIDHITTLNKLFWKVARNEINLQKYEPARSNLEKQGFFPKPKDISMDRA